MLVALLLAPAIAGTCTFDLDTEEATCDAGSPPAVESLGDGVRVPLDPRIPTSVSFDLEGPDGCEAPSTFAVLAAGPGGALETTFEVRAAGACSGAYQVSIEAGLAWIAGDGFSAVIPLPDDGEVALEIHAAEGARPVLLQVVEGAAAM